MNTLTAAAAARDKPSIEKIILIVKRRGEDASSWEKLLRDINRDLER